VTFADRADAGRRLAAALAHLAGADVVVLGLPRGGVPVAAEVAAALGAPLDVIVVRKLGVPGHREYAMGAVGEGGVRVVDDEVVRAAGVGAAALRAVETAERAEVVRRAARLRADRPRVPLGGRTAVVVDDGVATGSTARAACAVARLLGARRVVLATPVAPADTARALRAVADEVVTVETPERFRAVGEWYADFRETTDADVAAILSTSR
jgi:putative phosphoribosyl transferase